MAKKIFFAILILCVIIVIAGYLFGNMILQRSIELALKQALPRWVQFDSFSVDILRGVFVASGITVSNVDGFSRERLLEIPGLRCGFVIRNALRRTMTIEFSDLVFLRPKLTIERNRRGEFNLPGLQERIKSAMRARALPPAGNQPVPGALPGVQAKKLFDHIRPPRTCSLEDAEIDFIDNSFPDAERTFTLEHITSQLTVRFKDDYSGIAQISNQGSGQSGGRPDETIEWDMSLDPSTQGLTMSNRILPRNIDLAPFFPYIEKYIPLSLRSGRCSGAIVFDFDNGQIGSTNELELSNLAFSIKPGFDEYNFGGVSVSDIARYLVAGREKVIFDFKIKGRPDNLRFFVGPVIKQALTAMVINKVADALLSTSQQATQKGPQSTKETVIQIIDIIKKMQNK